VILELIGWVGSALLVFSVLQAKFLRFRILNSVASAVLVVYNGILGVWPMAAVNLALLVINLVFIARLLTSKQQAKAFTWAEADPALQAWFVARHGADIARFHPGLAGELPTARAALVFHDDSAIGIVAVRGDGTAQLLADYVIPAYRDYAPGAFVYSPAGPLAHWGVTEITTTNPARGLVKYLRQMGYVAGPGAVFTRTLVPEAI